LLSTRAFPNGSRNIFEGELWNIPCTSAESPSSAPDGSTVGTLYQATKEQVAAAVTAVPQAMPPNSWVM